MSDDTETSTHDRHGDIWKEINRLRDRMHEANNKLAVAGSDIQELKHDREKTGSLALDLAEVKVDVRHLIELEKGRFAKYIAIGTFVWGVVSILIQVVMKAIYAKGGVP